MLAALSLILALTSPPTAQQATVPAEEMERSAREERLHRAGFPPIQPQGFAFRRVMLSDPYMMMGVPGLEVRRDAAGTVDLVVQYPEWRSQPVAIPADLWDAVADDQAFAPPPRPAHDPTRSASRPPPICHDWSALIQDETGRTGAWHGCSGEAAAVRDVALRIVAAAMTTRPDCDPESPSPLFAFQRCFGIGSELDDPALEAVFAPLRRDWDGLPGAQVLAAARRALQGQGMRQGDAAWTRARAAVDDVRAIQTRRRELIRDVGQLAYRARSGSQADRYRLRLSLEHWSDFTNAQDGNTLDLLEQLLAVER